MGRHQRSDTAPQSSSAVQEARSRGQFSIFSPPLPPSTLLSDHWLSIALMVGGAVLGLAVSLAIAVHMYAMLDIAQEAHTYSMDKHAPLMLWGGVVPAYPPLFAPGASLGHNALIESWWKQAQGSPFHGDASGAQAAAVVGAAASQSSLASSRALLTCHLVGALVAYVLLAWIPGRGRHHRVVVGKALLLLCLLLSVVYPPCTPWMLKAMLLDGVLLLLAWRVQHLGEPGIVEVSPHFTSWML